MMAIRDTFENFELGIDIMENSSFDQLLAMAVDAACPIHRQICPAHLLTEHYNEYQAFYQMIE